MYRIFFKRILDFLFAVILLIILSPIILIAVVVNWFALDFGNPFFFQTRIGKGEKEFKMYKLKSMTDKKDANGKLLPDAQRITSFGKVLRKTSLDELPQLWNIIIGDMSFIGPRPLTVAYLPLYSPEQSRRHEVRPGITGWAQVNGRNHCKLSKKFEYDVWYVDHCSFLLDIKIICMTIKNVLGRKDVGAGNGDMKDIDDLGFLPKILAQKEEHKNNERNR